MEPLDTAHRGRTLRGVLHLPSATPAPAVLLCHGFGGGRCEFGNVFTRLARRLVERGFAACRFDFAGHGESDGRFADLTVSDQVDQAEAVLDRVAAHPGVQADRLSLLGMSLGGLTAHLLAGRREVRSLVLWAPAVVAVDFTDRAEDWRWRQIQEHGYADLGGNAICAPFIDDAERLDPWAGAAGHAGPVLMVGGTEDAVVSPDSLERYAEVYGERLERHLIEGADHGFGSVPARERLLSLTEEFIARSA